MAISLLEVSVLIIALAFLLLVIYLIRTLKTIQQSAEQINQSLVHMEKKMDEISIETTELLRNTNQLTLDLHGKSKSLDSIFQSFEDVGGAVQQLTASAKQVSSTISNTVQKSVEQATSPHNRLEDLLQYVTFGISLWEKIKQKREEKNHGRRQ